MTSKRKVGATKPQPGAIQFLLGPVSNCLADTQIEARRATREANRTGGLEGALALPNLLHCKPVAVTWGFFSFCSMGNTWLATTPFPIRCLGLARRVMFLKRWGVGPHAWFPPPHAAGLLLL